MVLPGGNTLAADFGNKTRYILLGVATRITAGGVLANFFQCFASLQPRIGAEGFSKQFAQGAAVPFGKHFGLLGQFRWQSDSVNP